MQDPVDHGEKFRLYLKEMGNHYRFLNKGDLPLTKGIDFKDRAGPIRKLA